MVERGWRGSPDSQAVKYFSAHLHERSQRLNQFYAKGSKPQIEVRLKGIPRRRCQYVLL